MNFGLLIMHMNGVYFTNNQMTMVKLNKKHTVNLVKQKQELAKQL